MAKRYFFLLVLLIFSLIQFAQGTVVYSPSLANGVVPFPGEPCASEYAENEMLKDPAYAQMRANLEAQIQQYIQQNSGSRASGVVYTIPVVFHIMHSGEAIGDSTNISFAQVQSTIAALNRDFRRLGTDGGIANSGPLGVDVEIEFCLAQRDPNGFVTNGVTRHDMSSDQDYLDSGVYHTPSLWRGDLGIKTLVNWNNAEYLNIWVVNKIRNLSNLYSAGGYSGGVQGYAYFPGTSAPNDGIVILSSACGSDPTGTQGYNLWFASDDGRVLTHEIGHYLNLFHTFSGTTACGTSGATCASIGDRCCDTPPTVVGAGNNCTTPVCPLENKENYMQYQNGNCASDFTPDQVARMRAVLALNTSSGRNALVTSNSCVAPPALDLELDTIFVPLDTICSISFVPEIVVCNNSSTDPVTSFSVTYQVDAGVANTYNWTGNLLAGECDTFSLPTVVSSNGSHTFTVRIDTVNLNGSDNDIDGSNNLKTNFFTLSGSNVAVVQTVTACDSFVSPSGKVWTTSGTFNDTVSSVFGCDSLLSFDITITQPTVSLQSLTICDSLISPSGKIWRTSGTYFDTIPNNSGCDSLMTFNLTVSSATFIFNPIIIACDSIFINGNWITSSRNLFDTVPSLSGCDSIFVDSISIIRSTWSITTISVCDSLVTGSGKVFLNSGLFYDTMPNAAGCDSTVEYYLTVNKSAVSTNLVSECSSFLSPTGRTYSSTGIYFDTLSLSTGCDSIITTYLVIDTPSNLITNTTICEGDSIVLSNGTSLKTSGTYFDTILGVNTSNNVLYDEDFSGLINSFTLNTTDAGGMLPGSRDNAWIVNNSYSGGTVFGVSAIPATPNQNAAITGSANSRYLHIHSRYAASFSFPSITNANYIDASLPFLSGNNGLNVSRMNLDVSTIGMNYVSFEMYYLCKGSYGRVYYSTNSGTTWTRVGGNFNTGNDGWKMATLVDTAFANKATLRFAVGFDNRDGVGASPGFAVDEIKIRGVGALNPCDSITQINLTVTPTYRDTLIDTVCEQISWRGQLITNSGTFVDTISTSCDSIFMLELVVENSPRISINSSICQGDSVVLSDGTSIKTSGVYSDTISRFGFICDSIITYSVSVISPKTTTVNGAICSGQPYTLPSGIIISIPGIYIDTLSSAVGCDSIVTTNLVLSASTSSTLLETDCGSYTSPSGKVFTTTGFYFDTITNATGCDSLITIDLTILPNISTSVSVTGCDFYTLPSGTIVTTSGIYNDTLISAGGCDSIITTNLTIGQSARDSSVFNFCAGQSINVGTNVYSTTGLYRDTFVTALGCDSLVITNLTINPNIAASITSTSNLCSNDAPVTFTAAPSGGIWAGNGINPTSGVYDPSVFGAGIFTITYTAAGSCGLTDSTILTVFSAPAAILVINDDQCDISVGSIDVTITGGTAPIIYSWSTGETTQDLEGIRQGIYSLTVTDFNNCSVSEIGTVSNVNSDTCDYNVYIPNVFSPNGDGENDVFGVEGSGIQTLELMIYNRYGNLVFQSNSPDVGWDGTYQGQAVNPDVFVYFAKGTFVDGSGFEQKGSVTIIRR